MGISRNVATAVARSKNWSALKALNAQRSPLVNGRCSTSKSIQRLLSATAPARPTKEDPWSFLDSERQSQRVEKRGQKNIRKPSVNEDHQPVSKDSKEAFSERSESGGSRVSSHDGKCPKPLIKRNDHNITLTFKKATDPDVVRSGYIPRHSIIRSFDENADPNDVTQLPIRDRLRTWERNENPGVTEDIPIEAAPHGQAHTTGMKIETGAARFVSPTEELAEAEGGADVPYPAFENGELVDFGSQRSFLLPGDLVELRTSGNRIELAIFIRNIGQQSQFYTMSGRWMHKPGHQAMFWVPKFVTEMEIEPLLAYLPDKTVPEAQQNMLQKFENALPRTVGGALVTKMFDFQKEADSFYRVHAKVLDLAYDHLARPKKPIDASLSAIARRLLQISTGSEEVSNRDLSGATIYAVFRALLAHDTGITPMEIGQGNFRAQGRFEIMPKFMMDTVNVTVNMVRLWQKQDEVRRLDSAVSKFIDKARIAIDFSRRIRAATPDGQVGPAKNVKEDMPAQLTGENFFDQHDLIFIRFMQAWVGWKCFAVGSRLTATGSAILRAVERYDDILLDDSTGWQFLQEIGYIKPWDTPQSYRMRLLGKRYKDSYFHASKESPRNSLNHPNLDETQKILDEVPDTLEGLRHDWKEVKAYCIDDPSAHEIDDAISLEKTDVTGEHWVHIHVADPASMIDPNGKVSDNAKRSMASTYLPDQVLTMLPDTIVQSLLTLAPNRPTLTFSAKLNDDGEMLDYKVTPGRIRNVVYVAPSVVREICGHSGEAVKSEILAVGNPDVEVPQSDIMPRHMSSLEELSETDKADIKLAISLGAAQRRQALLRGGLSIYDINYEVDVKFDKALVSERDALIASSASKSKAWEINGNLISNQIQASLLNSRHYTLDPYIALIHQAQVKEGDLAPLMLLGAEIAAQWCKCRNIPTIYRVSQARPDKGDLAGYFKKHVRPYYLRGEELPTEILQEYVSLMGPVKPSAVPGPHVPLGVEAFSRCTSPLRRYSDMITHYQIEAALRWEADHGKSLIGAKPDDLDFLPFSKEAVEELLPKQEEAEYMARTSQRRSMKQYAVQALHRAWAFGDTDKELPKSWRARVVLVKENGVRIGIEDLGMTGDMDLPDDVDLLDVKVGDIFEAEIIKVNPYRGNVVMNGLRRIETGGDPSKRRYL